MIDALVKFGTKDQNVVLSTMDKIIKKKKEVAKKANVGVGGGSFSGIRQEINARKEVTRIERDIALHSGREKLAEMRKEQFENNKLVKGAQAAGAALMTVAKGAASLDPVAFIQGTLQAAGTAATAIPFFGNVAKGALELAGISVGAAGGAVASAKQATPAALEIEKRNATMNRVGGDIFKDENNNAAARRAALESASAPALAAARRADTVSNQYADIIERTLRPVYERNNQDTSFLQRRANTEGALRDRMESQLLVSDTSAGGASGWTPTDKAQFTQTVFSAFGKPTEKLSQAINDLIKENKNVEQFTQVAGGNWSALGTDEGAILQNITNGFAGALPSVRQELHAELLKSFGKNSIENESPELRARRQAAATWQRAEETQTQRVANAAALPNVMQALINLDRSLNEVQLKLINGANRLADAVNTAVSTIML